MCVTQAGHSVWRKWSSQSRIRDHSKSQGGRHQNVHGHDWGNKDNFHSRNTASAKEQSPCLNIIHSAADNATRREVV